MGTELVPETLYSNELTQLCAREDYIESCRRESFKTYNKIKNKAPAFFRNFSKICSDDRSVTLLSIIYE
jgi:hypothetical protein